MVGWMRWVGIGCDKLGCVGLGFIRQGYFMGDVVITNSYRK